MGVIVVSVCESVSCCSEDKDVFVELVILEVDIVKSSVVDVAPDVVVLSVDVGSLCDVDDGVSDVISVIVVGFVMALESVDETGVTVVSGTDVEVVLVGRGDVSVAVGTVVVVDKSSRGVFVVSCEMVSDVLDSVVCCSPDVDVCDKTVLRRDVG